MELEKNLKQNMTIEQMAQMIIDYIGDYNQQEHPFLLFDLANVNENDHTKVLLGILQYNNYQFLPSFLQAIGAPDFDKLEEIPTDQKKAIGDKGDGFIDLFFQYKSKNGEQEKIIIENKIYGAGDTKYQLARYIATAIDPQITNERFKNEIWEKWKNGDDADVKCNFDHIHVVYLTSDGDKKPEEISLPKYFREDDKEGGVFEVKHINYYPINYIENIIPWLENDVLPNMPYSDAGIAIAGVRQYLAFLKVMFSSKGNSKIINDYFEIETDKGKYDEILSVMDIIKTLKDNKRKRNQKDNKGTDSPENLKKCLEDKGIDVEDLALQPLLRDLRAAATSIFSNDGADLGGDWKLYFTPSFIFLYRQRWADLDTRKYSIPSIYFQTSTSNFLKGKNIRWKVQVDHLNYKNVEKNKSQKTFDLGNHDKTAYCEIFEDSSINLDSASRKNYYKQLLVNLERYISIVDGVVNEIWNNCHAGEMFQEYALRRISEELQNMKNAKFDTL